MANERRFPRKVAEPILTIQMEPNNDAVVLDVSDGGMGFRAVNPVTRTGTICFSFSENGQRIESSAELVWTDSAKKSGGLSFASQPRANRERIRKWVEHAATPSTAHAPSQHGNPAPKGLQPTAEKPQQMNSATPPPVHAPGMPLPQSELPGFALFEDNAQRAQAIWDRELSASNSGTKFFSGFLSGAIVSALLIALLLLLDGNQTNDVLNQWRSAIGTSPALQATASVPPAAVPPDSEVSSNLAPAEPPPSSSLEPPRASKSLPASTENFSTKSAPSAPPRAQPESPSAASRAIPSPAASLPKTADPGGEELLLAQPYLNNKSGPAGSAVAVRLLWAAVEKGNVQAEITLADLYSRGDGVTKNCDQARVLLRAAAEKGSNEASQELATVIRTGCR
jgi:PilZ domain-containing protein